MARQRRDDDSPKMRQRKSQSKRPRISVSLDQDDYDWIQSFNGPSESYTVSRIIKAARVAGLNLDAAMSSGALQDLRDWLKSKRKKNSTATELLGLLDEFLGDS